MLNWMRVTWCKSMHTEAMWPINGKYICPRCLHEYPVPWEVPAAAAGTSHGTGYSCRQRGQMYFPFMGHIASVCILLHQVTLIQFSISLTSYYLDAGAPCEGSVAICVPKAGQMATGRCSTLLRLDPRKRLTRRALKSYDSIIRLNHTNDRH